MIAEWGPRRGVEPTRDDLVASAAAGDRDATEILENAGSRIGRQSRTLSTCSTPR